MIKGIDVSDNNGVLTDEDWDAIQADGVKFVICASSFGKSGVHDTFAANVNNAHARGMQVGAYHYAYALDPNEMVLNAQHCHEVIERSGVGLELPVFLDMEDADGYKARHGMDFSRENITAQCQAWKDNINYNTGIYASMSWFDNYIDWQGLALPVWVAQWCVREPDLKGFMWQKSENLWINGKQFDEDYIFEPGE